MSNGKIRTVTIPVEFRDAGNSMEKMMEQVKKAVGQVDLTTNLGKKITKIQHDLELHLGDYQQLMLQPTLDMKGLNRAEKEIQNFAIKTARIYNAIGNANIFDLNIPYEDLQAITSATEKIRNLNKEILDLQRNGTKASTKSVLTKMGQEATLEQAKGVSPRVSGAASLQENRRILSEDTAGITNQIKALYEEQQAAEEARKALQQLETQRKQLAKSARQAKQTNATGDYLKTFENIDIERMFLTDKANSRQRGVVGREFANLIMGGTNNTTISAENQHGAGMILKKMGLGELVKKDAKTGSNIVEATRDQIVAAVYEKLGINEGNAKLPAVNSDKTLEKVVTAARQQAETYRSRYDTDTARATRDAAIQQETEFIQAHGNTSEQLANINVEIEQRKATISSLEQSKVQLDTVNATLAKFEKELSDNISKEIQEKTKERDKTKEGLAAIEQQVRSNVSDAIDPLQAGASELQVLRRTGAESAENERSTEQQKQDFTENLKQMTSRWMSAQQIVNMVKNGIRQAYEDIQSLDKAMTNIAVVTDMSVSDLWGKIDEYMSIAQQYGVTTQGVYEVSQLFYQQGLNTNEVMSATTETLKMARQ